MTANCKRCKLASGSDVVTENCQLAIYLFFTNTNNEILLVLVVLNVFITAW